MSITAAATGGETSGGHFALSISAGRGDVGRAFALSIAAAGGGDVDWTYGVYISRSCSDLSSRAVAICCVAVVGLDRCLMLRRFVCNQALQSGRFVYNLFGNF